MEPNQKRALIAILSMLESGITQLRYLLDEGQQNAPVGPPPRQHDSTYLDEEDDARLERIMEEERLDMLKTHEGAAQRQWGLIDGSAE